jgi:formate dehydrogenase maturation protein FdhE
MAEREEDMAEADAEQDKLKTSRLETKRAKQAEILKHEKDRTDKAEKWKTDRIDAMKERQVKFAEIEDGHELKKYSKKARRQVSGAIVDSDFNWHSQARFPLR